MAFELLHQPGILHKLLRYNADTGLFIWLRRSRTMFPTNRSHSVWNARFGEKPAFTSIEPDGYCQSYLLGEKVRAHRIAWALHYGVWASDQIDHINGNKSDNRIVNLRNVPNVINARNMRLRAATHYAGVRPSRNSKRWLAFISVDYRTIYLGTFDTMEDAIKVRRAAELRAGFRPLEPKSAI